MSDVRIPASDAALRPQIATALRAGTSVAALVKGLARTHGLSFTESPLDRFAASAARLSDAGVETDQIEDLLVALTRAGVITTPESMALQAAHLRQAAA